MLPRLVMAAAAIALFVIGYQWGNRLQFGGGHPPALSGVMVRPPQPLPDFVLTGTDGRSFGRPDLLDRWSLIAFAPLGGASGHLALGRMIEVYNRSAQEPELQRRLALLLVTADDAPALAREFERLSTAIRILTGQHGELATLRSALGVTDEVPAGSAQPPLFLIGPRARLIALFPNPEAAEIATDIAALAAWPDLSDEDNNGR
jgi:peroxiredoxin